MPRLVQIVTSPLTAFNLMRGQLAALARHGFDIVVVTAPEPAGLGTLVAQREGVRVETVAMSREISPWADLRALVQLVRLLRRLRPEIVNASTPKAGLLGLLAARWTGVRCRVYTLRGLRLETSRGWRRAILRLAERLTASCAHRVVCVSESLRRRCHDLGLADPVKTLVLANGSSNGIDLERFAQTPDRAAMTATYRQRLGIATEAPVIGLVGRLTRDKGVEDLVQAFQAIDEGEDRTPPHLILLGDFEAGDPVSPACRRQIDAHPRIHALPFVEDVVPLYHLLDILALPSYREGFPNAVLEAAACGIPTVGYAATGTLDAVADGLTGSLVPVGDVAALAAALRRYLREPERRLGHGRASRERAERDFGAPLVWQAWAEFLTTLTEGAPGDA